MTENNYSNQPLKAILSAVLFVTAIFFFNFLSRVILSPLMPLVQVDFGLTHAGSGVLFFLIAAGNSTGLLLSGLISMRLTHRRTLALSSFCLGLAVLAASLCQSLLLFRLSLLAVGFMAGLYLPSGIATITSLVRSQDWGKALAIHELAPNGSYVLAPILAEIVISHFQWRDALLFMGAAQVCLGLAFFRYGKGGYFPGQVPSPSVVGKLVRRRSFWILALFFSLGIGGSFGPFSMLPLFLTDQGIDLTSANRILSVSRLIALFASLTAGWLTDKLGVRPMLVGYLVLSSLSTAALGLVSGGLTVAAAFVQPALSILVFPAGFTALSRIFPAESRSVAVSLIVPMSIFFGIGLCPAFLGFMGREGLFQAGFVILGGIILMGLMALPFLKLPETGRV